MGIFVIQGMQMNEDKLPKHIHRHRKTGAFQVPDCYKNNPRAIKKRATVENAKRIQEDEDFFRWYEKELKKHNPTKKQIELLDQGKRKLRSGRIQ